MASIREIGPGQIRVEIRRKGIKVPAKTFETWGEAKDYADVMEGKVVGGEYVGPNVASATTFADALDWYERIVIPRKPRSAKNKRTYLKLWRASRFASWKMSAIMPWDLLDWRIEVLDEENAQENDDGSTPIGPKAQFGVQQCWHYLQLVSHLFNQWAFAHKVKLESPVSKHVRPILGEGRDRRLDHELDTKGRDEEARLFAAVDASKSRWLGAAVRIALETGMRQAELATLTWGRVRLDVENPHADLPKTKNDRARRVPLSTRAIAAFKQLADPAMPYSVSEVRALNKGRSINTVLGVETGRALLHAFNDAVSEEEFPDLHWHDLRHEAISRLFENTDLRDQEIMAIVGHLSAESLTRYTHLRAHKLGPRLK
jgi:integrase